MILLILKMTQEESPMSLVKNKRRRKEDEFRQRSSYLTQPWTFSKQSTRVAPVARDEKQELTAFLRRRVIWGMEIRRSDIPLYLGGGEAYWM